MAGVIIFGIAVAAIFTFVAYLWFKAYFKTALDLGIKEFKFAFFVGVFIFCAILYLFDAGVLLVIGIILMSVFHGFRFNTFGGLAVFTVGLSSLVLLVLCYILNKSRIRAEQKNAAETEMEK